MEEKHITAGQILRCGKDGDQPKITYYDYVGGKMVEMTIPNDAVKSYVPVTSAVTSFEAGTWYVINGNVEIGSRIENNAAKDTPAHLILADGAVLTVRGGIRNESGKGLCIYGQKNGSGELTISDIPREHTGIGGIKENGGKLTINGGTINAGGGQLAAGIGCGFNGTCGTIIINGGTVTAKGGASASGIGHGKGASGGTVTINGGSITSQAGAVYGHGIGVDGITINGGTIIAQARAYGCGIEGRDITINGGTTIAQAATVNGRGIEGTYISIKSGLATYAGDSRETAKRTDKRGVGAMYVYISDACTQAIYTVSHLWQTVDGSGYEEHEKETLKGDVGWKTEAAARSYTGFTAQDFAQQEVAADGKIVVEIGYNRDIFYVFFNARVCSDPKPIAALYGAKVVIDPEPLTAPGYEFVGWYIDPEYTKAFTGPQAVTMPASHITLWAKWTATHRGDGEEESRTTAEKNPAVSFSPNWYADNFGVWRIKNSKGEIVKNAWLCDDAVAANGQNVWYLLTQDGAMLAAGLVQDATGNFYSLETNHDGCFGMLRYTDGYYNCNGQQVYLKFSHEHNGTFGAITNTEGLEKLKAIYGVTKCGIGNENAVYTKTF